MVKITFYGGVREIGGNKFLVEADGSRIFLDFGQGFGFGAEYFTGWLIPRGRFGLRDYFALDLIPKIPGLYNQGCLETTDFPYQEPAFDGVFISHIHTDHIAHLGYVDERIPVHLGETAKRMLDSWAVTSGGRADKGEHNYHTFQTGDIIPAGNLEVEPVSVDHSTPAAYGLIVNTKKGAIAYTGDLRRHGPRAAMTQEFINRAREAKPIALICEGTRVAPKEKRQDFTEQEVLDEVDGLLQQHPEDLLITSFYPRDLDRVKTYYDLARQHNRQFVVSTRMAHLLQSLAGLPGFEVPNPNNDPNIRVYKRDMLKYGTWEHQFDDRAVNAQWVHDHQREIILHLDLTYFTELIDINPAPGAVFVNSLSEPFDENDPEDAVKNKWLDNFHIERHQAHASGHCPMADIFALVNEINPQVVIPVHTEYPELFAGKVNARVQEPAPRQTITL